MSAKEGNSLIISIIRATTLSHFYKKRDKFT